MSVKFRTRSDSTATAGQDYRETIGTIDFQPNPNPNSDWPTATITYTNPASETVQFTPTNSRNFPTITVPVCDDDDAENAETIKLELHLLIDPNTGLPDETYSLTDLAELLRTPAVVTIGGGGGGTVPPIDELECSEDPLVTCPEPQQDNRGAGDPDPPIEAPVQDNRGAGGSIQGTPAAGQQPAGGGAAGAAQQADSAAPDLDLTGAGVHTDAILELHDLGVFEGTECDADGFCWDKPISRETAAVWIVRVLDGGDDQVTTGSTRFADVDPASRWAGHIERLADLGVTAGCSTTPARFCPDAPVPREQMAAFLVSAFDLPEADSAGFEDTVGSIFEASIDALHAAGVTAGCSSDPKLYCPHTSTLRAQMAAFLNQARNLN